MGFCFRLRRLGWAGDGYHVKPRGRGEREKERSKNRFGTGRVVLETQAVYGYPMVKTDQEDQTHNIQRSVLRCSIQASSQRGKGS